MNRVALSVALSPFKCDTPKQLEEIVETVIFANEVLEVALEHNQDPSEPDLVSLRDPNRPHDMPGEVLIAPADIPDLVKALAQAAASAKQS